MIINNIKVNKVGGGRRLSGFGIICLLVLAGVLGNANVARADPHAIYYTAIGQQQLFFNVLAALDQADYVETSLVREQKRRAREQVDAEQPFVRESESGARFAVDTELKQDQAGQSASDPSQPGEPSLVNRQVTLEGADLYTDQLVRQFGAESARRNAAAELLQALCANGFGFEDCDYDTAQTSPLEKVKKDIQRKEAMIVDPLAWTQMPYLNGVFSALNSGNNFERNITNPHPQNLVFGGGTSPTLTDEEYRAGKYNWPEIFGTSPMAYSPEIAAWRDFITRTASTINSYNQAGHWKALEGSLSMTSKTYVSNNPARYPFQEHVFDQYGNLLGFVGLSNDPNVCNGAMVCLNPNAPEWSARWDHLNDPLIASDTMTVESYLETVDDIMRVGLKRIDEIASSAAVRIGLQQEMIQDEGVLAKTSLQNHPVALVSPNANPGALSAYGELSVKIDTPVAAREASIYGIPNVLGMLATSQEAGSLEGLDIPGSVQLVKRAGTSGGNQTPECSNGINDDNDNYIDYPQDPECASPTDTSELLAGQQASADNNGPQVAGALDLLFDGATSSGNFFDQKKRETSPSANIISPILEFGARHALRVLTAGKWRESTAAGPTCGFTCD